MAKSPENFFLKSVRARHNSATASVETFLRTIVQTADPARRVAAAICADNDLMSLQGMMDESFHPMWLKALRANLQSFRDNPNDDSGVVATLRIGGVHFPQMQMHKWTFEDESSGIDFDQLFTDSRDANEIPKLFDSLIDCLQHIIDTGAIDSLRVLRELETIVATLKSARTGSYIATRSAWQFVAAWMRHTGWQALGDIPILGAAVRGLRETMAETDRAMLKMHEDVSTATIEAVKTELPHLTHEPLRLPLPKDTPDPAQR